MALFEAFVEGFEGLVEPSPGTLFLALGDMDGVFFCMVTPGTSCMVLEIPLAQGDAYSTVEGCRLSCPQAGVPREFAQGVSYN